MNEATIALTIMTVLIFIIFLGFLVWGIKSRQFHNIEEVKYRIFDEKSDGTEQNRELEE
jgi:cbb3-type cytochrome oxidase maturation protein